MDPSISRFIFARDIVFFLLQIGVCISHLWRLFTSASHITEVSLLFPAGLEAPKYWGRVCVSFPSLILDKELDSETQLNQHPYANIYKCGYIS